ncbi:type II secretion system major pseudopilin GspG [Halioxenophilus sp. WMMB6]|uniref:type II secretion system major pseudopilin GspG n=1 Tax=Halioxenophilus sp. WMMB6 TaxID=3073815 RepID=UPI00295EFE10|nr:type II secretion system major pseudopilin GspG [Halioxenophilus sp. WMMB6]
MKRLHRQQGFSLIEIMVVLVIMGLLIGIVAPRVLDNIGKANYGRLFADFKSIETALQTYRLDNYVYPSSEQGLGALVEKPSLDPVPRKYRESGYLPKMPKDPWGRDYLYLSPGESHEFEIFSYGADGVPGGEGDNRDVNNWDNQEDF